MDTSRYAEDGWIRQAHGIDSALVSRALRQLTTCPVERESIGGRLQDEWRVHEAVRSVATDERVMDLLTDLYGRRPIPFQTLTFRSGSQQRLHADTIHFDSLPSGLMCGVWVALEDVGPDQGPLRVVSGSHLLPVIRPHEALDAYNSFDYQEYEDLVARRVAGLDALDIIAEAGDVVVWDGNLVHGGSPVGRAGSTRWSQVTHYFFEGAAYITPMASDFGRGEYAVRHPLIDIATGSRVDHMVGGQRARMLRVGNGRTRLLAADGETPPPSAVLSSMVRHSVRSGRRVGGRAINRWRERRHRGTGVNRTIRPDC